jgi:hypothetical protein
VRVFKDDTGGLLKDFSIFSPSVCPASYFLKIIGQKKTKEHRPSTSAEHESLLRIPSESDASPFFNMSERSKSFQNILILWGTARTSSTLSLDQVRPIIRPPKHLRADGDAILVAVEDTPVFVREGSPIWDHRITGAIFSRVFVKFYIILGCMMGVGQM